MFDQLSQNIMTSADFEVVVNQNELALHVFQPLLVERMTTAAELSKVLLLLLRHD